MFTPPAANSQPGSSSDNRMTSHERRATASLTSVFALRMLGLFLVLPVFALEAASYPGGLDAARVGFAMGYMA